MTSIFRAWPAALLLAAVALPARAADTYTIDPASSMPSFEVTHLGFTTQRGRFNRITGQATIDWKTHQGSVDFNIDSRSLDMGSSSWTAHLADEGLFNVIRFPAIVFRSEHLNFEGDRVVGADGTLTVIGVSAPVHLVMQRFHCGPHPETRRPLCGGDVSTTLRRSAFGLIKYLDSASDEVRVNIPVVAYKN
jgi:polyisoprenoid-binding protein YceI